MRGSGNTSFSVYSNQYCRFFGESRYVEFLSWKLCKAIGLLLSKEAGYHSGSRFYPFYYILYFKLPCISFTASTPWTSYSILLSSSSSGWGSGLDCPKRELSESFCSFSAWKTRCIFIDSSNLSLNKCSICLKIS
jgi:hypothetical protein